MSSNARRLAAAVLARRQELDLTQLDVWQSGGPSNTTLTKIENAEIDALTRTTARKLDAGLKWEPGSARDVYDKGLRPLPISGGARPDRGTAAKLRELISEASDLDAETRAALLRALDERGAS